MAWTWLHSQLPWANTELGFDEAGIERAWISRFPNRERDRTLPWRVHLCGDKFHLDLGPLTRVEARARAEEEWQRRCQD